MSLFVDNPSDDGDRPARGETPRDRRRASRSSFATPFPIGLGVVVVLALHVSGRTQEKRSFP
jgi:hypothetical protein